MVKGTFKLNVVSLIMLSEWVGRGVELSPNCQKAN